MNGLTVDFAHTSARGKILIKPYPETADEGNTVGLISESPPCLIQAGPCSAVGGNLLKRNSVCFCVTYLESVGDHPGSNVSDTSFRCSEPIMLRGCRQLLEGQIQLDIICIRMHTSQVVLNDVEDPSYIHDR